jgi:hypothetical protein
MHFLQQINCLRELTIIADVHNVSLLLLNKLQVPLKDCLTLVLFRHIDRSNCFTNAVPKFNQYEKEYLNSVFFFSLSIQKKSQRFMSGDLTGHNQRLISLVFKHIVWNINGIINSVYCSTILLKTTILPFLFRSALKKGLKNATDTPLWFNSLFTECGPYYPCSSNGTQTKRSSDPEWVLQNLSRINTTPISIALSNDTPTQMDQALFKKSFGSRGPPTTARKNELQKYGFLSCNCHLPLLEPV